MYRKCNKLYNTLTDIVKDKVNIIPKVVSLEKLKNHLYVS